LEKLQLGCFGGIFRKRRGQGDDIRVGKKGPVPFFFWAGVRYELKGAACERVAAMKGGHEKNPKGISYILSDHQTG